MAVSIEKVIHNLHFDRLFLDKIEQAEQKLPPKRAGKKALLHANGIPFHYIAVFKTLLCMREADMRPEKVQHNFLQLFGHHINQSSLSRTLSYLRDTLNLIQKNDNAFANDRFKFVRLTSAGKKFQKHLIGSTAVAQPYAAEMRQVINMEGAK